MTERMATLLGAFTIAIFLLSANTATAYDEPVKVQFNYGGLFWSTHTWFQYVSGVYWNLCTSKKTGVYKIKFYMKWDDDVDKDETNWGWYDTVGENWEVINDDIDYWGMCPFGWTCIYGQEDSLGGAGFYDGKLVARARADYEDNCYLYLETACTS